MRFIVLALLWLMAAGFLFMARLHPAARTAPKPAATVAKPMAGSKRPSSPVKNDKSKSRAPICISTKGRVQLKAGETAVLSYWEIAPGMNGMALVTPELTTDGNILMKSRILQVSDEAVRRASAEDMFPDIFDSDHYGAVGPARVGGFLEAIADASGAHRLSAPTIITRPGMRATISIGNADGEELSLGLEAAPQNDGGFDVSLDFNRSGAH